MFINIQTCNISFTKTVLHLPTEQSLTMHLQKCNFCCLVFRCKFLTSLCCQKRQIVDEIMCGACSTRCIKRNYYLGDDEHLNILTSHIKEIFSLRDGRGLACPGFSNAEINYIVKCFAGLEPIHFKVHYRYRKCSKKFYISYSIN